MQLINLFDQTADVLTPSGKTIRNADLAADPFFGVLMSEPCAVTYGARGEMLTLQPLEALKSMYGVTEEDPDAAVVAIQSKMDESDHRVKATMVSCESLQRQLDALGGMEPDTDNDTRVRSVAQVATLAKLTAPSINFASVTATDVAAIPDFVPEWKPGMSLKRNDPVKRKGTIYRASQDISETQKQYPPETAGESLYYPIEVAPDGIIVYRTCHGDYDMVRAGEKRHYPGAEDQVYLALEDTAYSPDAYPQHWQLEEAE